MIHSDTAQSQRLMTSQHQKVERWFYIGIALVMIAISIAGFAPSMLVTTARKAPLPLTPVVMTHAIACSAWLLFLLLQTWLAATRRIGYHRRLGMIGAAIIILIAVSAWMTVAEEIHRGFDLSGDLTPPGTPTNAGGFMSALIGPFLFVLLATAAILLRRRPEIHKRLVVLATIGGLSSAPLLHFFMHWPALRPNGLPLYLASFAVLLMLQPIYDRISRGRMHPVSLWGGVAVFVIFQLFFGAVVPSASWNSFADWLVPPR